MSSIDIFTMSIRNLFKRKLRTFLTVLGVIIGTAAIIVMISLGIAVNQNFEESLTSMGDIRILTVYNPGGGNRGMGVMVASSGGGGGQQASQTISLDDKAVSEFRRLENVYAVSPVMQIGLAAVSGKYSNTWAQIKGFDMSVLSEFEYTLAEGVYTEGEKYGAIFGAMVSADFRNPNDRNWWRKYDGTPVIDPMSDKIDISYENGFGYNDPSYDEQENAGPKPKPIRLNVKGVMTPMNWNTDYYIFMDIKEVQKIKSDQARYQQSQSQGYGYTGGQSSTKTSEYDQVLIKVNEIENVEAVKLKVEEMGFYADSYFIDMLNEMTKTSNSLQIFLGAIGAVSLFVAAIGIANTMIMSIYERTREIGIMKVIGASLKDIKRLFLLESTLIGLIGGLSGLALSYLISYLLNNTGMASTMSGMTGQYYYGEGGTAVSVIPLWLSLAALAFSCVVGLVSGYFPARRAMSLSAIAAIRSE